MIFQCRFPIRCTVPGLKRFATPFLCIALGVPTVASAQIVVVGEGRASAAPDTALIVATVFNTAERADDALVRYQDARRQLVETLESDEWPGLQIQAGGVEMGFAIDANQMQQMMFNGGGGEMPDPEKRAAEELILRMPIPEDGLDDEALGSLLALAQKVEELGASLMPPETFNPYMGYQQSSGTPMFAFAVTDGRTLQRESLAAAILDAREEAQATATLAGLVITGITAIGDEVNSAAVSMYPWMGNTQDPAARFRNAAGPHVVISTHADSVEVVTRIQVTFSVAPATEATTTDETGGGH